MLDFPFLAGSWILLQNPWFIILLHSTFRYVHGENLVSCPDCGEPLVKESNKGKYNCENESCPVIYVEHPFKPGIRRVVRTSLCKH